MTAELITIIGGVVTLIVSNIATFLVSKRKYNSEVDNTNIKNMQEALTFYKALSDDNKERLDYALSRCDELQRQNIVLQQEVAQLRTQLFAVVNTICTDLTCQNRKYSKEIVENLKNIGNHETTSPQDSETK